MAAAASTVATPGAIVRARGRDWVVLPPTEDDVVRLRPLTGTEDDAVGLFLPLEGHDIQPSTFPPPDPTKLGDARAGLLLRNAARLSLRDGAAPFRSLGRIAVTPRPYQFVPLLMALRLEVVRLLIADDVGVGKTVEAGMIARELLDRGLARRLAVLCPPHLCEQWEQELREKFGLSVAVIQPARIGRLERDLPRGDLSIYQYYPYLVASIDFVKSDRNRRPFLDNAPDLLIVDEAHGAARPRGDTGAGNVQQQRYTLLRDLARTPLPDGRPRHLILVTATPHSGIEESFRSLLGLLDPQFDVDDPASTPEFDRRQLEPHLVQRRRRDVEKWLGDETPFPEREASERSYALSANYESLFGDVLAYCRETIQSTDGLGRRQQRVRHWAAIALLRCLLSSPDAATAVLAEHARKRFAPEAGDGVVELAGEDELDTIYRPQVLDAIDEERAGDYVPTAPVEDAAPHLPDPERRRLAGFLRRAGALAGPEHDAKLRAAAEVVQAMLRDGFQPIVFCRFIATAVYLATWLPKLLGNASVRVVAVTGEAGDEERREKVEELARAPVRVLVATDCLSEGINLQDHFDAVVHYDLPWNPNRLEQREGRVDRFGQPREKVRAVVLYGANNEVDLVVLQVLVRKARQIRSQLGITMPVPAEADQVMQAVVESVLLRTPGMTTQARMFAGSGPVQARLAFETEEVSRLHESWEAAAAREGRQHAYFAQRGIKPEEVQRELEAADPVLGDAGAVQEFLTEAVQRFGGALRPTLHRHVFELEPGDLRDSLQARGITGSSLRVTFQPVQHGSGTNTTVYLGRTHPVVATVCDAVLGRSLDPHGGDGLFARCGALRTDAVTRLTIALLLRLRYLLREHVVDTFAEEVVLTAHEQRDGHLVWLEPYDRAARDLLDTAKPVADMPRHERTDRIAQALELLRSSDDWSAPIVAWRVGELQTSHERIRKLEKASKLRVVPREPPDVLGLYVLAPR